MGCILVKATVSLPLLQASHFQSEGRVPITAMANIAELEISVPINIYIL